MACHIFTIVSFPFTWTCDFGCQVWWTKASPNGRIPQRIWKSAGCTTCLRKGLLRAGWYNSGLVFDRFWNFWSLGYWFPSGPKIKHISILTFPPKVSSAEHEETQIEEHLGSGSKESTFLQGGLAPGSYICIYVISRIWGFWFSDLSDIDWSLFWA